MKPLTITDSSFEDEVLRGDTLTIVDFWAPWCGPCKIISPVLELVAHQYDGRVKVTKLNVDENPSKAQEYGVYGIPALLFFKNGKIVDKLVGAVPREQLKIRIERLLA